MYFNYKDFILTIFPNIVIHQSLLPFIFIPIILIPFKGFTYIIYTFFIVLNSLIRLGLPSSYKPLTQIKEGVLYSPVFARIIATFAEIIFYRSCTFFYGLNFDHNFPYYLTITGEIMCWLYIGLQSDLFGFCEDSIWTLLQLYFLIFSKTYSKYIISLPFIIYMISFHLPLTYKQIKWNKLFGNYLVKIEDKPNMYNLSWQIPSLLLTPILFTIFNIFI